MHKLNILERMCLLILATPVWVLAAQVLDPGVTSGAFISALDGRQIDFHRASGILANTANYDWWYGCSPTSAGMMMSFYDRNGYKGNDFGKLVPGGQAEADSYGAATPSNLLCNKVIASSGHIADFWVAYDASGPSDPDPLGSGRTGPGDFDCLADFMGTSQDSVGNVDGGTTFWYFTNGAPLYEDDAVTYGVADSGGMYGIGEYVKYAGYDVGLLYNQYVDAMGKTYGFTLAQYQAEIDAGRPVLIHTENHTMLGYGYDSGTTIHVYDTWDPNGQNPGTMTWGGTYGGASHLGVTVLTLVPEPSTLALLAMGVLAATRRRGRHLQPPGRPYPRTARWTSLRPRSRSR